MDHVVKTLDLTFYIESFLFNISNYQKFSQVGLALSGISYNKHAQKIAHSCNSKDTLKPTMLYISLVKDIYIIIAGVWPCPGSVLLVIGQSFKGTGITHSTSSDAYGH